MKFFQSRKMPNQSNSNSSFEFGKFYNCNFVWSHETSTGVYHDFFLCTDIFFNFFPLKGFSGIRTLHSSHTDTVNMVVSIQALIFEEKKSILTSVVCDINLPLNWISASRRRQRLDVAGVALLRLLLSRAFRRIWLGRQMIWILIFRNRIFRVLMPGEWLT